MEQDTLGVLLREVRKRQSLTARQLSEKLQQESTYISRLERGMRTIDVIEFTDIAKALGVDPLDLYREFLKRTVTNWGEKKIPTHLGTKID